MSNEAKFGIAKILRPYAGFETIYDPLSSLVPLMLTEVDPTQGTGGQPLDPLAGTPGYDPELVRGVQVPLGARILIWIPRIVPQGLSATTRYEWRLIWRLRNPFDYRMQRLPFNYPKQGAGVPDGADTRVVIPACYETVDYNQAEVSTNAVTTVQHALREDFSFLRGPIVFELPQNPSNVSGQMQQGIAPAGSTLHAPPAYLCHETMAKGNELLIGFSRPVDTTPTWEFALDAADGQVSIFFGAGAVGGPFPDVGVYVMAGASS